MVASRRRQRQPLRGGAKARRCKHGPVAARRHGRGPALRHRRGPFAVTLRRGGAGVGHGSNMAAAPMDSADL